MKFEGCFITIKKCFKDAFLLNFLHRIYSKRSLIFIVSAVCKNVAN